jgi:1,4-dihydroxy-2-naphthoyl-CoA synthase
VRGAANTADIFFRARKFDAQDALRMGFVRKVVPVADLDREVAAYAATMGENAPLSLIAAKAAIREVLRDAGDRDMGGLQKQIDACFASDDYTEGRKAFMEKRTPDFKGR